MKRHTGMILRLLALAALAGGTFAAQRAAAQGGTLLQCDFNQDVTWPQTKPDPKAKGRSLVGVVAGKFGTIDVVGSKEPSGGLLLGIDAGARDGWTTSLKSGPLPVKDRETNLGKLTLSFSLSASRALPVKVVVESFNGKQERSGALETMIYPAAADFYQRYALELSTLKASGEGSFDPTAPFVGFTFEIGSAAGWPAVTRHEVRLDNIHYATPAYYVSPKGSDAADGRTEKTAFATPQKAVDAAQPGDIIVLMNGTYGKTASDPPRKPVAKFSRPGKPADWITLKNYPGHQPVLSAHGRQAVSVEQVKGKPTLAYLELRGLHVRGNADTVREQFPGEVGQSTPNTDMMGIHVNGRTTPYPGERTPGEIVHNIRLADNLVEFCTADGIFVQYCDWLFVENNTVRNNCWFTQGFAPAGFALMGYANFDAADNAFKILIARNRIDGNRLTVPNQPYGKEKKTRFFNGNGMLLDANAEKMDDYYLGRTLVQNNLVFNNGGGGIQMWGSHRLDIINNTLYHNGATPELKWGQFGVDFCRDVRIINNIVVAQPDRPLDCWQAVMTDRWTDKILRVNNLFWGGVKPNIEGIDDMKGDPLFVNASADPALADFRLKDGSPALKAGRWETFAPILDLEGKPRPLRGRLDLGAFQK